MYGGVHGPCRKRKGRRRIRRPFTTCLAVSLSTTLPIALSDTPKWLLDTVSTAVCVFPVSEQDVWRVRGGMADQVTSCTDPLALAPIRMEDLG